MDPIFALAAASIKVALTEHATGSYEKLPLQSETFTNSYKAAIKFIHSTISTNIATRERYHSLCSAVVARGNRMWPNGVTSAGDDQDDLDDNYY